MVPAVKSKGGSTPAYSPAVEGEVVAKARMIVVLIVDFLCGGSMPLCWVVELEEVLKGITAG
jgi:hypothetical protein